MGMKAADSAARKKGSRRGLDTVRVQEVVPW